jgi:hypothetical protein
MMQYTTGRRPSWRVSRSSRAPAGRCSACSKPKPASDPEGEIRAPMLAALQAGDRRQELIDDSLAARP